MSTDEQSRRQALGYIKRRVVADIASAKNVKTQVT